MAFVRNPVVYVPDLTNGRPIVDGKVYLLTAGTVPPTQDSAINPATLLTVTYVNEAGNTVEQPQPLYTSKGGCLYGSYPDSARQYIVNNNNFVFAVYSSGGSLSYSAETTNSDFVAVDDLASEFSNVVIAGVEAGDLIPTVQAEADRAEAAAQTAVDEYNGVIEAIDAITADPANAVTQIFIPAQALQLVSGTATLGPATSRLPAWLLPKTTNIFLSTAIRLPSHWATMRIRFIAANTSANAGNVVFAGGVHNWSIGDSINVSPTESNVTAAIPSTAWITGSYVTQSAISVDPTKYQTLRIYRNAGSASDTLPNTVALLGVLIEKES